MFVTVGTKLTTIVSSVINNTYNFWKKLPDWYPYACVVPWNALEEVQSNNTNIMELAYRIEIYFKNQDIATTEWEFRTALDSIMTLLRNDYTLTWSVLNWRREIETWYSADAEPLRMAVIKCIYKACVTI